MEYVIVMQNGELYHHGVKGQKWGERRYQNEDGSLTEEGKKRYYSVYGVNANHYNKEAEKLEAKANKNRLAANMNTRAAETGKSKILSKINKLNADYYTKKANKLMGKANVAKSLASMNEAAGEARAKKIIAKHQAKINKSLDAAQKVKAKKIAAIDEKIAKVQARKDYDVKSFDAIKEDMKYKNGKTFYSVADAKRDQEATAQGYDKVIAKLEKKKQQYS